MSNRKVGLFITDKIVDNFALQIFINDKFNNVERGFGELIVISHFSDRWFFGRIL